MAAFGKPLMDVPEKALKEVLRASGEYVGYSNADIVAELDRRSANRQSRAGFVLSVVSIFIALAALLVTALKP